MDINDLRLDFRERIDIDCNTFYEAQYSGFVFDIYPINGIYSVSYGYAHPLLNLSNEICICPWNEISSHERSNFETFEIAVESCKIKLMEIIKDLYEYN